MCAHIAWITVTYNVDQCGEYYSDDGNVEMYEVNGMTVCEYCYEDMDESDEK